MDKAIYNKDNRIYTFTVHSLFIKLCIWLFVVSVKFGAILSGQPKLSFERLSVEQGLSQASINSIFQDRKGFLWFGTYNGLNRYDGYTFKVFKTDPKEPKSISGNVIRHIIEDRAGNLWIATTEGLNCFDRKKEQFIRYLHDSKDANSINTNCINYIYEDRLGAIWLTTNLGVVRFDREKEQFINYSKNNHILKASITCIYEDKRGQLWIGGIHGIAELDRKKDAFISYPDNSNGKNQYYVVNSFFEDQSGTFWISRNDGLFQFDRLSKQWKVFPLDNQFLKVYEEQTGELWFGTSNGLFYHDKKSNLLSTYKNDPDNPNSMVDNFISYLYKDRSNTFWIGTRAGLNKLNRTRKQFQLYQANAGDVNSLSYKEVCTVKEDSYGHVWIGTRGGLDRLKNQFVHYRHDPSDPASLSSSTISSILETRDKQLWVGTSIGLNRYDRKNNKFVRYMHDRNNKNSLIDNGIVSLGEDWEGNLWIGTWAGLCRFDTHTGKYSRYYVNPDKLDSLNNSTIWTIMEDKFGVLWFGTDGGGLNRFDKKKESFTHYKNIENDSTTISDNRVISLYEDHTGTLWVGTSRGLNRFIRDRNTFVSYTVKNGLANDVIYSIEEDNRGNLWLGTGKGLSKFNMKKKTFRNYVEEGGAQKNEFCAGASFKNRNGELYFGGVDGLTVFHPDSIRDDTYVPSIVLTDLKIFNQSVLLGKEFEGRIILEQSITEIKEIELSYKDNVFSIEYAALHYLNPEKNQYAYMMEGFETKWNNVGNRHIATYTNLPPGEYTFRVKGASSLGVWNEQGASLKIKIIPPFWLTWWFKLLAIIIIAGSIMSFYLLRISAFKRQQIELEQKVNERTIQLKRANEGLSETNSLLEERHTVIEEQSEKLYETNEQLVERNTFIEEQSEELKIINEQLIERNIFIEEQSEELKIINEQLMERQEKIEKQSQELLRNEEILKEANELLLERQRLIQEQTGQLKLNNDELSVLNSTKDRLFSIIAHDLRNPFNVVSGFSELLLRDYSKLPTEKVEKYLNIIFTSSAQGNALLENLLQWSRCQTDRISFEPVKLTLSSIVEETIILLEGAAQRKNIALQQSVAADIVVFVDENMIKTVIRNLISNAIKFTRENGTISIQASVIENQVEVIVADNGVGIPPQLQKTLFHLDTNISTRGTSNESGTGLGLILCKEFVEKHNGRIWVESEVGKGSKFKFTLPLT